MTTAGKRSNGLRAFDPRVRPKTSARARAERHIAFQGRGSSDSVRILGQLPGASIRTECVLVLAAVCVLASGCHTGPQAIVSCPIPASEQQGEVLKIAPLQTDREEVLRRLEQAGIDVSPGAARPGQSPTLYYCNIWQRPDGARWQMDVALLFDASGKLYATRPSHANTVVDRNPIATAVAGPADGGIQAVSGQVSDPTAAEVPDSGPRLPFTKER